MRYADGRCGAGRGTRDEKLQRVHAGVVVTVQSKR